MIAVILIKAETGKAFEACENVRKIDGIVNVHVVTGPYDIVAIADLEHSNLRSLVASVHDVKGILRTETCLKVS
jgi:hypothetical protein